MIRQRLMVVIWNMGIGGIQKRMRDVSLEISRNYLGWDVYLMVRYRRDNVLAQPLIGIPRVQIHYFAESRQPFRFFHFLLWLGYWQFRLKPQVVLTFLDYLTVLTALVKRLLFWQPAALVVNEGVVTSAYLRLNRNMKRFPYWLVRWAYRQANLIIVPTTACRKDTAGYYGIPYSRFLTIPNWTLMKPTPGMIKKKRWDVMFAGRFETEKGIDRIKSVVEQLLSVHPHIRWVLVGRGSRMNSVRRWVARTGLDSWVEIVDNAAGMEPYYRQAKLLFVPSRNEGMPNVVLEAAIHRVPVVAWNFAGCDEVVLDGQTGIIVSGVPQAAEVIQALLRQPHRLQRMGEAAEVLVRGRFGPECQRDFITAVLTAGRT